MKNREESRKRNERVWGGGQPSTQFLICYVLITRDKG